MISKYNDKDENNIGKKKDKENNLEQKNNANTYMGNALDSKSKRTNNSSLNYLMESNSRSPRDKPNNSSINASKELLANSINTSFSNYSKKNNKENNSQKEENNEDQDNINNIIFLFLDYSGEKNKDIDNNNNFNIVNLKLLEFKKIIDDFDLNRFEIYSKNLDNINKNKTIYIGDNINNDEEKNHNNIIEKKSRKNIEKKPNMISEYNDENNIGKKKR